MKDQRIIVAGAGAIGCFVGGLLVADGRHLRLLARPRIQSELADHGLTLTDFDGLNLKVHPEVGTAPDMLAQADVILVCVKGGATAEIAELIAQHAPKEVTIVSLQNGLGNADVLRTALPDRDVRAGVVGFNVVHMGQGVFHRSVSGKIHVEGGEGDIGGLLGATGLEVQSIADIKAVQRGKLILNLTNALNALSGLTLREMLLSPAWRRVMAAQMSEALDVFAAAKQDVRMPAPAPNWLIPHILRLPNWAFERVAKQMLTVDAKARTSMVADLASGKTTEVDALQGEIIRLAEAHQAQAPIAGQVRRSIKRAEAGEITDLGPDDISLKST